VAAAAPTGDKAPREPEGTFHGDFVWEPPDDSPPLPRPTERFVVTAKAVEDATGRLPLRRGTHRDGWTWESLKQCVGNTAGATAFALVGTAMLAGDMPDDAALFARSGVQLALAKDGGTGVRPAVMGTVLRRLAVRVLVRAHVGTLRERLGARQFAVGHSRGVDQMHAALQIDSELAPAEVTRARDIANAHNSFSREAVAWLLERDPDLLHLLPAVELFMGEDAAELWYYGDSAGAPSEVFHMVWGGHQGTT
jgi:hypothetical protein